MRLTAKGVVFLGILAALGCSSVNQMPPMAEDPVDEDLAALKAGATKLDQAAAAALLDEYAKRFSQGYPLYPGDKLQFAVLDHTELSFTAPVPVEGWIDFPAAGKIVLAGRTVSEVRAELIEKLGKGYLVRPDVTVIVQEYAKRNIYVIGAVWKPSDYALPGGRPITLMQAISQAGGFKDEAEKREILIFRPKQVGGVDRVAIPVDVVALTKAIKGSDPLLLPEDIVFVPTRDKIFVFGQVTRAGSFMTPSDQTTTITKAISMAGGFTRIAKEGSVRLNRRGKDGKRESYVIDVGRILDGHPEEDVPLQPGDVIFVPESFF